MILQNSLLVTLVKFVDRLPMPAQSSKRERGRPIVYTARLFLEVLVIMIVRHLHKVNELPSGLAQPTPEMTVLRTLLSQQGRFPLLRTWESRQISASGQLTSTDWLFGPTSDQPDRAVGQCWMCGRHR